MTIFRMSISPRFLGSATNPSRVEKIQTQDREVQNTNCRKNWGEAPFNTVSYRPADVRTLWLRAPTHWPIPRSKFSSWFPSEARSSLTRAMVVVLQDTLAGNQSVTACGASLMGIRTFPQALQ